jgi:hypothetical protein
MGDRNTRLPDPLICVNPIEAGSADVDAVYTPCPSSLWSVAFDPTPITPDHAVFVNFDSSSWLIVWPAAPPVVERMMIPA